MPALLPSTRVVAHAVALVFTLVACGTANDAAQSTNEVNAPGDIPDSQVFVPFTTADRAVTVRVPEGWAQRTDGPATVFADKLLGVRVETRPAAAAPTVDSVNATDLPRLRATVPGFQPDKVTADRRPAGPVVVITYTGQSTPDQVTGKAGTESVERYLFWHNGTEVVLTLSAPAGTDTTDAWRTITDSVSWP